MSEEELDDFVGLVDDIDDLVAREYLIEQACRNVEEYSAL